MHLFVVKLFWFAILIGSVLAATTSTTTTTTVGTTIKSNLDLLEQSKETSSSVPLPETVNDQIIAQKPQFETTQSSPAVSSES